MPDDVDAFDRAWIFLSIGDAGGCTGPVARVSVVQVADAYSHSVPSAAQLDRAIASLVDLGLAASSGDDVGLTATGCDQYSAISRQTGRLGHIARLFQLADEWSLA